MAFVGGVLSTPSRTTLVYGTLEVHTKDTPPLSLSDPQHWVIFGFTQDTAAPTHHFTIHHFRRIVLGQRMCRHLPAPFANPSEEEALPRSSPDSLTGGLMRLIARSSMLAVIITVTALVARPSGAQESQTPPEAVSAGEGGAFFDQVDPRTGAMTYVYRFDLPAARGLSGPALGLQYNSSTRDREAGYGWGLDVPSIELRPLAGLARFDVAGAPLPNGHERYAFQGQSLVKICDVGAGCPAEPSTQGHPVWANGWTYYRLRVEGLFARFYRSANRSTWRVQFKGGEIVEFGTPVGETHGMPSAVEYANGGIVRWHPVARRDLQHPKNVVLYRWQPYGTRGILYLTDIYDTPSLATPTSISAFAHHTQLNWDGLDYAAGNYQSAERAAPDFRLARVAVASKSWTASGAREVYRVYALDYYAQRRSGAYDPIAQGPLWHHSFLRQIRLSGHCGQTEKRDGTIGESQCARLPAMQFDYEPGVLGGFIANVSQIQAGPPGAVEAYGVLPFPESAAIVDFDRDGLPDVIQSWQGPQCSIADPRRRVAVRQSGASGGPELYCIQGVNDNGDTYGPYDKSLRSARPILGYQNRGKAASFTGSFRYQCMDAGGMNDSNSILQINAGSAATQRDHITQFFNAGSNTVLGAFGMGLGVWGRDERPIADAACLWCRAGARELRTRRLLPRRTVRQQCLLSALAMGEPEDRLMDRADDTGGADRQDGRVVRRRRWRRLRGRPPPGSDPRHERFPACSSLFHAEVRDRRAHVHLGQLRAAATGARADAVR